MNKKERKMKKQRREGERDRERDSESKVLGKGCDVIWQFVCEIGGEWMLACVSG